jgi:hypothetical protein
MPYQPDSLDKEKAMFQTPDTAMKKASLKKGAAPQPATTRPTTPTAKPATAGAISPERRNGMVAEAAYYIAERRGFAEGSPIEDWLMAEAQIDAMLSRRKA